MRSEEIDVSTLSDVLARLRQLDTRAVFDDPASLLVSPLLATALLLAALLLAALLTALLLTALLLTALLAPLLLVTLLPALRGPRGNRLMFGAVGLWIASEGVVDEVQAARHQQEHNQSPHEPSLSLRTPLPSESWTRSLSGTSPFMCLRYPCSAWFRDGSWGL